MKTDRRYIKLSRIAAKLPPGTYTTEQLMKWLERNYRKHRPIKDWILSVNTIIDHIVHWEFIIWTGQEYIKPEGSHFVNYTVCEDFAERVKEHMRNNL